MSTRAERLLEALGGVREDYIAEAEPGEPVRVRKRAPRARWIALAACLAAVIALPLAGARLREAREAQLWAELERSFRPDVVLEAAPDSLPTPAPVSTPVPTLDGLPMLTIHEGGDLGMGFEGIMVRDVEELDDGSPWTPEAELNTLPVYRNTAYADYMPVAPDGGAAMLALAEETAEALGTEITQVTYDRLDAKRFGDALPEGGVLRLEAETPRGEIRVDAAGSVGIFFEPYDALPDGSEISSREAAEGVTELLLEKYAALHGYQEPRSAVSASYSFSGEPDWILYAYDGAGGLEEQLSSRYFNHIWFGENEGELIVIWSYHSLTYAEKLGDYPIISPAEAEALLREGRCITTVPDDEAPEGEFSIARVELVYRTGQGYAETYLPYYRFLVELPRSEHISMAEELTLYGAYYVPAVEGNYLTNMPLWDGSFN